MSTSNFSNVSYISYEQKHTFFVYSSYWIENSGDTIENMEANHAYRDVPMEAVEARYDFPTILNPAYNPTLQGSDNVEEAVYEYIHVH